MYSKSNPMQQEAFPHQYLRSRICFARTIAHAFIMVLVQMRNPKIDNFDWIKMKGQLRLALRIEDARHRALSRIQEKLQNETENFSGMHFFNELKKFRYIGIKCSNIIS
jgi:hypothetical protein